MRPCRHGRAWIAVALLGAACSGGCAYWRVPRIDPTGERIFAPAPPRHRPEPEGQRQWDNVALLLEPRERIAAVGDEVVLVASVVGPDRYTTTNERVEWSVAPGGVGEIVRVGEGAFVDLLLLDFTRPHKINSAWAVTSTTRKNTRLTRGTADTGDDVCVSAGQAWVSVTSPVEGTSHVTAYAPSVYGWPRQRQTAVVHWVDAQWTFPPPSINPAGTRHVFTTAVSRQSDGTPHAGWLVRYDIVDGPPAGFVPDGARTVEVATNALGHASVEMVQTQPAPGTNRVNIQIFRPAAAAGPEGKRLLVASGAATKTWSAPGLAVRKLGPPAVALGSALRYVIEVSNPGDQPADAVTVVDQVPDGATFLDANPAAQPAGGLLQWQLGQLVSGQVRRLEVNLRADRLGTLASCAEAAAAGGLRARECVTTAVTAPGLDLRVSGPAQVAVGAQVRFEIVLANRGQATATSLVMKDRFEPGLRHAAAAGQIEAPLPDLAPGAEQRLHVDFQAAQAGQLCHTVEVLSAGRLVASQQACVTAVPPAQTVPQPKPAEKPAGIPPGKPAPPAKPAAGPALSVTKTGPAKAAVGDMVVFDIEVVNTGTERLTAVRVVDEFDPQLRANRATEGFDPVGDALALVIDELPPGDRVVLQVEYECLKPGASVCTRSSASAAEGVRQQAQACLAVADAPAPGEPPDLSVAVTDLKDPVFVGDNVTYRVTVTNNGRTAARDVTVTAKAPRQMVPNRLGTTAPCEIEGQNVRFQPVAQLRPGETLTYRVIATARAPGDAELVAEVVSRGAARPTTAAERTVVSLRAP